MTFLKKILRFLQKEEGPTAVEYAVMLMLIFAVVIFTVQALGVAMGEGFENSRDKIAGAMK